MFGWIDSVLGWANRNIGGPVIGWVHDVLSGIWGFIHTIFGNVSTAWGDMYAAGRDMFHAMHRFADATASAIYWLIRIEIPALIRWAKRELKMLADDLIAIERWAVRQFDYVVKLARHLVTDAIKWVVTHVYDPLLRFISTAWQWITHEGTTLWYYLTHPDELVSLLWTSLLAKLEADAWNAGQLLGRFLLSLVLHNVKRFALLIEDIVMAVL